MCETKLIMIENHDNEYLFSKHFINFETYNKIRKIIEEEELDY